MADFAWHGRLSWERRASRVAWLLAAILFGGMHFADRVRAEAYIAVREGYKCSQCHFNKTGGGKRNDFANVYVQTRLAQHFVQWQPRGEEADESAVANMYHGRLNDFVSLGADMRYVYSETHVPHTKTPERDLSIQTGLLYLQLDMVPDRGSFYLDQNVQGASTTREMFILFDGLPLDSYLKLGRFFLASGFRLQDDTAFVRQYSGFTYGNPDTGLEFGMEPGPFSLNLWTTSLDKKRGATAYLLSRPTRIGVSYSIDSSVEKTEKTVSNIFWGLHFGRFTVLSELDHIVTETDSKVKSEALLLELNYMSTKGANLKLSYDAFDPDLDAGTDIVDRFSLIYEPFLTQFLQLRLGARKYTGQADNDQENREEYFLEVHAFFY